MITLSAEQFNKKYGTADAFPATQKPTDYVSRVKSEIGGSLSEALQSEKQSISGTLNPLAAGANIAKNVTGAILSPVTQAIAPIANKTIAPILNAITSKITDTKAVQDFTNLLSKHPQLSGAIADTIQTGFNVAGVEGGVSAVKGGFNLAKTGVNNAVEGTKNALSSAKQSVYGGEQPNFVDNLITPKLSPDKLSSVMKTGKVTEGQGLLGQRELSNAIPGFQDIKSAVAEVPGISPRNTNLENLNLIHNEIGTVAKDLESQVGQEKSFFSPNQFKSLMNDVKSSLGENPTIVGDAETAASKVATKFQSLVAENGYNPKGLLLARKALDKWILSQKGAKVFSPATESGITTAVGEIRQAGNNFLADISPNTAVKALLKKQANLYRAIDAIAPKAATEGNSLISQFIKAHPVLVKAGKIVSEGTIIGKTANLLH